MKTIVVLILTSITALLSLPVLAVSGESGDGVTCYAEMGGVTISSACSTRGTTCNEDSTCSIGTTPGTVGPTVTEQTLDSALSTDDDSSSIGDNNTTADAVSLEENVVSPRDVSRGLASGKRTAVDSGDSSSATENSVKGVGDEEEIRVKLVAKKSPVTEDNTDSEECQKAEVIECSEGDKACEKRRPMPTPARAICR